MTSRLLSGLPPRNRVSWVPLLRGGFFGIDLYGNITEVTRTGGITWVAQTVPFLGDRITETRTRSLTAARCRAKVDRLVRKAQGHG